MRVDPLRANPEPRGELLRVDQIAGGPAAQSLDDPLGDRVDVLLIDVDSQLQPFGFCRERLGHQRELTCEHVCDALHQGGQQHRLGLLDSARLATLHSVTPRFRRRVAWACRSRAAYALSEAAGVALAYPGVSEFSLCPVELAVSGLPAGAGGKLARSLGERELAMGDAVLGPEDLDAEGGAVPGGGAAGAVRTRSEHADGSPTIAQLPEAGSVMA